MPSCHANYTRWAGDIRVGKCVFDLGVRITPGVGFHHEGHDKYQWDMSGGGFPYGHLSNRASSAILGPVSFHHLTVDQIALYYRMSAAESRGPHGELYRWDFSSHFLKEFMHDVPQLNHRIRLLFGIAVEVQPTGAAFWRRDFGDPLYIAPKDGGDRFEMVISKVPEIFNGDGCDAQIDDPMRTPVRKSALIAIQCEPCSSAEDMGDLLNAGAGASTGDVLEKGAVEKAGTSAAALRRAKLKAAGKLTIDGPGQICAVRRDDSCTLRIELALICPARELVYAPQLDVGYTPGGSELVRAGAPATCSAPSGTPPASMDSMPLLAAGDPATGTAPAPDSGAASGRPLYVTLTHGSLAVATPKATLSDAPEGCAVRLTGQGAVAHGGRLEASAGPQPLFVHCGCPVGTGKVRAYVTLTIRVREATSPTVTFPVQCEG